MFKLETLLQLGHETQTFEVKGSMAFSVESLAKDLLAMANHRDGGSIVIGVEDGTFNRVGVTAEQKATFNADKMRDKMRKFADPPIRFDVYHLQDANGVNYVVITVATFERVPVVSRSNNNKDVYPGMVYYRNTDRRVESAAISNADDMLELIMTAIQRTRTWLHERGYEPVSDAFSQTLDEEVGDL